MKLSRHGREDLRLTITTTPQLGAWEASFDDGLTWTAGTITDVANQYAWLLAGPAAIDNPAGTIVLARGEHAVSVRAPDSGGRLIVRDTVAIVAVD